MLSFLAAFWMVGNFVVAGTRSDFIALYVFIDDHFSKDRFAPMTGLAWAVIPLTFQFESESIRFNSWRLFTILSGLPSLSVAIILLFFPESPRSVPFELRKKLG